ncbi:HNH endonuclease [Alicycliphilus denitrificans]
MWRSGSDAGAIAIGVVVEVPTPGTAVKHPEALGADLWRTDEPDLDEPRTGIRLQEIRLTSQEGFLPRVVVKADLALSSASIITMPNGTVFPLDATQANAMERLWGLTTSQSLPALPGASEGQRKLMSHYRRERSNTLRLKKLAEVRARHGKCVCALCGIDDSSKYPRQLSERIFEVHHLLPLATAATPVRTTLDDLVVLCASCHRAVHATSAVEDNYAVLAGHLRGES